MSPEKAYHVSRHEPGEGAPARNCWCGIHVCQTPEALLEIQSFVRRVELGDIVLGRVECGGVKLWSAVQAGDPRGTWRVERARLLRLDVRHMRRDRAEAASSLLQQRYGVPVVDGYRSELHDALFGVPR
jgi:hypothetical protein